MTPFMRIAIPRASAPPSVPPQHSAPAPGLHTNEVWHTTDPDEPTPAVVQVVKSAEPAPGSQVKVGETIKYTLHVTNTGDSSAVNWGVHDMLQDGLELVDGSVSTDHHGTVVNDGRGVAWVIEKLDPKESVDLTFSVKVATPQIKDDVVQNQATLGERKGPEDVPTDPMENTSNIVEHYLLREPKPVITKTAITKGTVTTGQTVEFLVTVRNDGNADIVDHVLVDQPEEGLAYESDDKGGIKQDNGTVTWRGITLAPGQEFQVHVKFKVTAKKSCKLRNVAILYRPDGQKLVAVGDAEAIIVVSVASDLIRTGVTAGVIGGVSVAIASGVALAVLRRRRTA